MKYAYIYVYIYIYIYIEKLQPVVNAHFLYVELGKAQVVLRLKALITMLR